MSKFTLIEYLVFSRNWAVCWGYKDEKMCLVIYKIYQVFPGDIKMYIINITFIAILLSRNVIN